MFLRAELQELISELADVPLQRTRAGARHMLGCAAIARLAQDSRLIDLATQWLDGAAVPFKATLFDKSPDANWLVAWHQDTALPISEHLDAAGWGPWSEKCGVTYAHAPAHVLERVIALRVHLDDSTADNGPLRVLPGTHTLGVLSDSQVHELSLRVKPVTCTVAAGGVVVMRPLIIHASSKINGPLPRRVLHLEYASSLALGSGLELRVA
jgi:ectoine hydroxylase-related dioxygenase (phytanoyl-CoA dioxygenase family)